MKLIDLINTVDEGYGDGCISAHFDPDTSEVKHQQGDTLAEFVVIELSESFDPDADDEDQISAAVFAMERAKQDIENVITALMKRG